jgi:hypothetical protein
VGWIIPVFLAAAFFGLLSWRLRNGSTKSVPTHAEYWVFGIASRLPPDEAIIKKIAELVPPGATVASNEGLLLTDIRLKMATVLRSKNPHSFRPDLFEEDVTMEPETLEALTSATSFIRIQYISTAPLRDAAHLRFLPYLAAALGQMTRGRAIYDPISQAIWSADEFMDKIKADPLIQSPSFHVQARWYETVNECRAYTLGLEKVGLPEWSVGPVECDEKTIILQVMQAAAEQALEGQEPPYEHEEFGDTFVIVPDGLIRDKAVHVDIRRRRAV